jgi:hypothetical protein
MTVFELWLLGRPEVDWKWWNAPGAENSLWEFVDQAAVDPVLRSFYLCQLGIWFYTVRASVFFWGGAFSVFRIQFQNPVSEFSKSICRIFKFRQESIRCDCSVLESIR